MATIVFKRGNTFIRTCTLKIGGVAQDLTGVTIACRIAFADGTTEDLIVTLLPQSGLTLGKFKLTRRHSLTAQWPIGTHHRADIQYTFPPAAEDPDGIRDSTDTFLLSVAEDITP